MSKHDIPEDLSIPEFLRRPVTPQTKAAVTRVMNEMHRGTKLAPDDDRITISTGYAANLEEPGLEMLREIIKRTKPESVEHDRAKRALRYGERKMRAKAGTKETGLREMREHSKPIKGSLTALLDKPIDLTKQTKVKVEGDHVTVTLPPEPVVAAAIKANGKKPEPIGRARKLAKKKADVPGFPIEVGKKKASAKATKPAKVEKPKATKPVAVSATKPVGKMQIVENMLLTTKRGVTKAECLQKVAEAYPGWIPWRTLDMKAQLEKIRRVHPKAKLVQDGDRWRMTLA